MAAVDYIVIEGKRFGVYPIGTNFKANPGIYLFLKDGEKAYEVLYVGETDSFKRRLYEALSEHHRYQCAVERNGATHIAVYGMAGGKTARLVLETRLRNKFDPPCNRQ